MRMPWLEDQSHSPLEPCTQPSPIQQNEDLSTQMDLFTETFFVASTR